MGSGQLSMYCIVLLYCFNGETRAVTVMHVLVLAHVLASLVKTRLGKRLHESGFICNRIVFDAVTPSVYTTPIETVGETGWI